MRTVVHIGKFYPPVRGGMERVLESLCHATAGRVDNRVIVFNTGRETVRETVDGIPVTRVGAAGVAGSVPVAPSLVREIRRIEADLIVVHEPNPWALLALALVRAPAPLAVWFHSEVVRPRLQYTLFYHPLVRRVYAGARRIIVSSPALAEHAGALLPYRDRTVVVPFGIDAGAWAVTPDVGARAAAIRREAGGRPMILFTGRMVPYKGVDVLLRAMQGVDACLVLAGGGPSAERWRSLSRGFGVDDKVRFAGEVDAPELRALYHACDIFVLPSVTRAEAFGYVQLEAMACGKPVVSTRLRSGVPWVNRHDETGLTVTPGDPAALRQALALLAASPVRRAQLGAAGRARVSACFSMDTMAAGAVAAYEEACVG